jgi:hypothetical protein
VTGEIGRGGFGTVYRARHAQLGVEYALKVIRPDVLDEEILERFFREMAILASLNHPNVVRVHTSGRTASGEPYYVMELLRGTGLDKRLARSGKLPVPEAARLLAKVARGVGYAHSRGIVHRDLKPENILVTEPDDEPRLVDFGLAIGNERERLTRTGDMVGTPSFMAPEQIEGAREIGPAADVWALGVIFFFLTTGKLPFGRGAGTLAVLQAILTREPPLPSSIDRGLPPGVDEVFLRCCERDPADRYETAAALVPDLEALSRGEEPSAEGRVAARKAARTRRRLRRALLAVVSFGLLGASLSWAATRVIDASRKKKAEAHEALARAREALDTAIGGFDTIERGPGDERLVTVGAEIGRRFAAYEAEIAKARAVSEVEPPQEELEAMSALAAALLDPSAGSGSEAWERIPGVKKGRRADDARYAFAGARLALAAGHGREALARLSPYGALPAETRKPHEPVWLSLVGEAEMLAAGETLGKPDCVAHLGSALAAGFSPERTPASLASELPGVLARADDDLQAYLTGLIERRSRETTELTRRRRELERIVRAGEVLGCPSYRSEELISLAAAYESAPGVSDGLDVVLPRTTRVDEGERLFLAGNEAGAIKAWNVATVPLALDPSIPDVRYPAIWHWIFFRLVVADRQDLAKRLVGNFQGSPSDPHFLVAKAWSRFAWKLGEGADLEGVVAAIDRSPALKASSLRGEALLLRGEARIAAQETVSLRGLEDLVLVLRDDHARRRVRELAATHGKELSRIQGNEPLATWFDAALAGDPRDAPPVRLDRR